LSFYRCHIKCSFLLKTCVETLNVLIYMRNLFLNFFDILKFIFYILSIIGSYKPGSQNTFSDGHTIYILISTYIQHMDSLFFLFGNSPERSRLITFFFEIMSRYFFLDTSHYLDIRTWRYLLYLNCVVTCQPHITLILLVKS
jgi:hypothetical protein